MLLLLLSLFCCLFDWSGWLFVCLIGCLFVCVVVDVVAVAVADVVVPVVFAVVAAVFICFLCWFGLASRILPIFFVNLLGGGLREHLSVFVTPHDTLH